MSVWILEAGMYKEALLLAVNIAKYNKNNPTAFLVAGDAYFELDDTKEAKKYYNELLTLVKDKTKLPVRVTERTK